MTYKSRVKRLEKAERTRKAFPLVISGVSDDGFLIGGGTVEGKRFSCWDILNWPAPVLFFDAQAARFYFDTVGESPRNHHTEVFEEADGGIYTLDCPVA